MRYRLTIAYDGTDFLGWQRQATGRTVQGDLEEVLRKLNRGNRVTVVGAGRTDSGVHARGQVAHVDLGVGADAAEIEHRLNRMLGSDILVRGVSAVDDDFHARFDAMRRGYRYQILTRPDPFLARYTWYVDRELSSVDLQAAADSLLGRHDFTALSKVNRDTANMVCDLQRIEVTDSDGKIAILLESDRFLYGMVRIITGLLVDIGSRRRPVSDAGDVLLSRNRNGQSQAAPANGLFFERVWYPGDQVEDSAD